MFLEFRSEVEKLLEDNDIDSSGLKSGKVGDLSLFVGDKDYSLKPSGFIGNIKKQGPFLNFFIDWDKMAPKLLGTVNDDYGKSDFEGKIIFDTTHPNVGKPMHVGHLRSAIIGDSLIRIHKFLGYDVVSDNYLGDWGTQYGKLAYAFEQWGSEEELKEKGVNHLLELYIRFHEEEEKNPNLIEKGREYFARMEEGDERLLSLWKKFVEVSRSEMDGICSRLGISFDTIVGESEYAKMIDDVYEDAEGTAKEDDGALIIPLDGDVANLIIKKSNGASTYATRDLARIKYISEKYSPDKSVYVVSHEQAHHFKQVFMAAKKLGYDLDSYHISYGLMTLPEGKMSTRKGRIVLLTDLLDEATERAKRVMEDKSSSAGEDAAKKVGIGAVKFADLSQNRVKDIVFTWDKALSFDGKSGPYIQYTYSRAKSILKKSDKSSEIGVYSEEDIELLTELSKFPEVVQKAAREFSPHVIAEYVYDLSVSFNKYYEKVRIIGSEGEKARLKLVEAISTVIKSSMNLLGIDVLEQM